VAYTKYKRRKLTRMAQDNRMGKVCTGGCGQRLTLKSYAKNASRADGLEWECRECRARYRRERTDNFKKFSGRCENTGKIARIGSHKKKGWEKRMRQLEATGRVLHDEEITSRYKVLRMRLVCGKLQIVGD